MAIRRRSSLAPLRFATVPMLALSIVLVAGSASAQDKQMFGLGKGSPDSTCVSTGPNVAIDSTPVPDDHIIGAFVLSGSNGICQTPLSGDDVRPPTGIVLGGGLPNAPLIVPGGSNGICDDVVVAGGDDVVRIPPGQSEPRQVAITAGGNLVINSIAGGDDVATAAICPGPDHVLQSTGNPADIVVLNADICTDLCGESLGCIIPGVDDILQS